MFKKLAVLLFLIAIISCHATDEYVEDQQDVDGGQVDDEKEASDLSDRMLNSGKGDLKKAGALGELVETDEAAMKEMQEKSEKLIKAGEHQEKSFGNALDVILTSRTAYVCGTRRGRRRCRGTSHCCPRSASGCCDNDCCFRGNRFCTRLGFCANRFGVSRCNLSSGTVPGRRCSSTVCCPLRIRYNQCAFFSLTRGRTLTACVDSNDRVPCGTPPTPGTVCRNGRCCRRPLRCCLFGCCR